MFLELALAVDAAVLALCSVGELEDGGQLLLGGGDAAGVLAVQNALQLQGQVQLLLLHGLAVSDDGDGDAGVHIAQSVGVQLDGGVDLDDVLAAHLLGGGVVDEGHHAVQAAQVQEVVDLLALTCGDVVDDDAVDDGINIHSYTPRSFRIRAMRIYLPHSTCLK